jgi:arylsulfatase A-like enzyme
VVFEKAYSPSSWTRTAIASLLTSRHPFEHRVLTEKQHEVLDPEALTLAEFLADRGHKTALFYTNPHYKFGVDQGFSYTDYVWNDAADRVVDRADRWLAENADEPFFLLIHFMDPHDKYEYHAEFPFTFKSFQLRWVMQLYEDAGGGGGFGDSCANRTEHKGITDDGLAEFQAAYDGEIAFTDLQIGRLLDSLEAHGHKEDTLVIITADHGEEFLDHGGFWHGCTLYDELIRAPLLIQASALPPRRINQLVSLVDVFPTIVDLIDGESLPALELSGQSLLPLMLGEPWQERPVVSATAFRGAPQHAVISGQYKLILHTENDQRELYDLRFDTGERLNLLTATAAPGRSQALAAAVEAELRALGYGQPRPINYGRTEAIADEELLRQLEALGYVGD